MLNRKVFIKDKSVIINYFKIFILTSIFIIPLSVYYLNREHQLKIQISTLVSNETALKSELQKIKKQYSDLENEDQYLINQKNKKEIEDIQTTYKKAVDVYEKLLDIKTVSKNTANYDKSFAEGLNLLSQKNYASGEAVLTKLNKDIDSEKNKIVAAFVIPENLQAINTPPSSGYRRQRVDLDIGSYMVDIISADLNSTRVIVDTASDSTCANDCPVLSLSDYVSRNGAFAGINGAYFCPAAYPSCAGRTNSFDTLLMNKNKVYFNSDNNVYSNVPAVIFGGGWVRFVGRSLEWGRDTGVDSVLANQPLLVSGSQVVFGGDEDPKKGSKGSRSFVAAKGSNVYIGVVHSATVAESARVLQILGMENALNLDSGGSTALWYQGYKAGPGRNIPNALLFVRK